MMGGSLSAVNVNPRVFREFYNALIGYRGSLVVADLIEPWLDANGNLCRAWLAQHSIAANEERFGMRSKADIEQMRHGDLLLHSLYAFSRILDLLLLPYQQTLEPSAEVAALDQWLGRGMPPEWSLEQLTPNVLQHFVTALGLGTSETRLFDPFHHEIARVVAVRDSGAPISILKTLWPMIRSGDLLIARQGVVIEAGSRFAKPGVADKSTLFWSYWRYHRPTNDASMGWGQNSQWATDFRRDYETPDAFEFNFDYGERDEISKSNAALPGLHQRRELVMNRSLLTEAVENDRSLVPFRWSVRRAKA
jgi:hypothetical protein